MPDYFRHSTEHRSLKHFGGGGRETGNVILTNDSVHLISKKKWIVVYNNFNNVPPNNVERLNSTYEVEEFQS